MVESKEEDLSKLKQPKDHPWFFGASVGCLIFALVFAMLAVFMQPLSGTFMLLSDLFIAAAGAAFLKARTAEWNYFHNVWWYRDADKKWRVTAKGYPAFAQGLVIRVKVALKPEFTLFWGPEQWRCVEVVEISGGHFTGFLVNGEGERLKFQTWDKNLPNGISREVLNIMYFGAKFWKIQPFRGGVVLRFTDQSGRVVDVQHGEMSPDLVALLGTQNMVQFRDSEDFRRSQVREDLARAQKKLEASWSALFGEACRLWLYVRASGGRPESKLEAAKHAMAIFCLLEGNLPSSHVLRNSEGRLPCIGIDLLELVNARVKQLKGNIAEKASKKKGATLSTGQGPDGGK